MRPGAGRLRGLALHFRVTVTLPAPPITPRPRRAYAPLWVPPLKIPPGPPLIKGGEEEKGRGKKLVRVKVRISAPGVMGVEAVVDLAGRVCIVTGASSGSGREVARNLGRLGATVVLACRNEMRGVITRDAIALDTGNPHVTVMPVDLSSQASVRAFARRLLDVHPRLHVLVNNAAVCLAERRLSAEGIEVTWATNVLGYHLLSRLLLDRLVASAPSRIVNLASTYAGGLNPDDPEFRRRRYHGVAADRQSKQADRLLTWALAARR